MLAKSRDKQLTMDTKYICVDLNGYNIESRNLDIISVFWYLLTIWACSCCLHQWLISHWARTLKGWRQKLGIHITFQESEPFATWMRKGSLHQRRTLLLLHVAQVHCPSHSCKGKSISMHLSVFRSTSSMYWHTGIIYNTHITCGTGCHKTLSLSLFWRFSHYKQNPKMLRFLFIYLKL